MKKFFFFILLSLPLITFQACEKRLDIVPASVSPESLILSSVDGLNGGLNFAYQQLHTDLGRHFTIWSELLSDHLLVRGGAVLPTQQFIYDRNLDAVATEPVSSTDPRLVSDVRLRDMYNCVNTAALILRACENGLAESDLAYADNKDRIMGECYFLRAVCHFELVRYWALPWGTTADNSHPGIIINEQPVDDRISQIKPRASVAKVYAFIIRDLQKADSLLPETFVQGVHSGVYKGRAYRDAAKGFLAKVYFQQGNYVQAKEMIDQLIGSTPGVITGYPLQASLTQLFSARGAENTDPECIYQTTSSTAINASQATYWNSTNPESIYPRSAAVASKGIVTTQFITDAHFYPQDLRLTLFKTLSDGRITPTKYCLVDFFNIPLIRSAEMVLDRAEIYASDNRLEDAVADCNTVRQRAQIPLLTIPISKEALLDSIRTERIRELCFEGDRLHDLRRKKQMVLPGERAGIQPLAWNSKDLVLKYSQEDMARNPQLENNY